MFDRRLLVLLVVCCVGWADLSAPSQWSPGLAPVHAQTRVGAAGGAGYETVTLTLPRGNAEAGRQAFIDLRCTACHEVAGEMSLPTPVSSSPGPTLGVALAGRPPGSLATAIVAPSHAMSVRTSPETRANVAGVLSPMGDYSDTMTVRQLLDLVAYLDR